MIYIGIDPGVSGGLAFINGSGLVIHTTPMPQTERDLLEMLDGGFVSGQRDGLRVTPSRALIERVSSSPGWGHVGAFTFGRNYGALIMALTAARIPFDQVTPQVWQTDMGIRYRPKATSTVKKNITKRRAQQLFPQLTITHAIADALLIAEHCRRTQRGLHGEAQGHQAHGDSHEKVSGKTWLSEVTEALTGSAAAPAREGAPAARHGGHPGQAARQARQRRGRRATRAGGESRG